MAEERQKEEQNHKGGKKKKKDAWNVLKEVAVRLSEVPENYRFVKDTRNCKRNLVFWEVVSF